MLKVFNHLDRYFKAFNIPPPKVILEFNGPFDFYHFQHRLNTDLMMEDKYADIRQGTIYGIPFELRC